MDSKEASSILEVNELSSQQAIDAAFKRKVEEIGKQVRGTTDPSRLAYLKGELRKCVTAKKSLLPNAPIMDGAPGAKGGNDKLNPAKKDPNAHMPMAANIAPAPESAESDSRGRRAGRRGSSSRSRGGDRGRERSRGRARNRNRDEVEEIDDEVDEAEETTSDQPRGRRSRGRGRDRASSRGRSRGRSRKRDEEDYFDEDEDDQVTDDQAVEVADLDVEDDTSESEADDAGGDEDSGSAKSAEGKKEPVTAKLAELWAQPKIRMGAFSVFAVGILLFLLAQVTDRPRTSLGGGDVQNSQELVVEFNAEVESVHARRNRVYEIRDEAQEKINNGESIKGETLIDSKEVYQEIVKLITANFMVDSVELERQETLNSGGEAFNDGEFFLAMSIVRDVGADYDYMLNKLKLVEPAALARIKARRAKQEMQNWVDDVAWDHLPVGQDIEAGILQGENAYLELELENSIKLFRQAEKEYTEIVDEAKKLLSLYQKLENYQLKWDLMSWSEEVEKTLTARELKQQSGLLDKALQAGNVTVAIEILEPLLKKYPAAIAKREQVNKARREVDPAQTKFTDKTGYETHKEASEAYKKGIVALRGGDWERATLQFNRAKSIYLREAGIKTSSSAQKSASSAQRNRKGKFETAASRTVPEMVKIRGGSFKMGDLSKIGDAAEQPVHTVTLKSFSISKFEISFAQYDKFAKATGRKKPNDEGWGRGSRPVINVTWHDAVAYTKWLSELTGANYRLPTEAEWEYAARAGSKSIYYWGNRKKLGAATCRVCGNAWDGKRTSHVGTFKPNAWGLYDMLGNASEWVLDCWNGDYNGVPSDGSAKTLPGCKRSIVRGGSWEDDWWLLRVSARYPSERSLLVNLRGFRVVKAKH